MGGSLGGSEPVSRYVREAWRKPFMSMADGERLEGHGEVEIGHLPRGKFIGAEADWHGFFGH